MKLNNKYYILRHGEALSNVKEVMSCWPETFENPLTRRGREMIKESAKELMDKKIDLIFSSDLLRAEQTAQIVGQALNITPIVDARLREIGFGNLNGQPIFALDAAFKKESDRITQKMPGGETYQEVQARAYDFLQEIDKKYEAKHILIVSHEGPPWMLEAKVQGMSLAKHLKMVPRDHRIHKGQVKERN